MRCFLALSLWLVIWPAFSHPEGEAAPAGVFDCEHPPAGALAAPPPAIAEFSRMECSPRGQFLMAGDGWTWRFPGSFFNLPSLAAYTSEASLLAGEPRHFRSIDVTEVAVGEREQLHQRFVSELPTYGARSAPVRMLKLAVVDDAGNGFEVFMPFENDSKGWVIPCVPDCPPEYVFMMEKFQQ
jgi:hypothetical protein